MYKGSTAAKLVTDAQAGETYLIGESSNGFGAFHPKGSLPDQTISCVKHGMTLTLSGIPAKLCRTFGIKNTETVKFLVEGDDYHDRLEFSNGMRANLIEFATCGVNAYVCIPAGATAPDPITDARDEPATVPAARVVHHPAVHRQRELVDA